MTVRLYLEKEVIPHGMALHAGAKVKHRRTTLDIDPNNRNGSAIYAAEELQELVEDGWYVVGSDLLEDDR